MWYSVFTYHFAEGEIGLKIIFLDFDGVLNSVGYVARCGEDGVVLDPSRMELLKQLVAATDAKIVLTTSWREYWSKDPALCTETGRLIDQRFAGYGLQIYDKTPRLRLSREAEISRWLGQHPEVQHFVVLDDMLLSGDFLRGHYIKTANFFHGLEAQDVELAIGILNGTGGTE